MNTPARSPLMPLEDALAALLRHLPEHPATESVATFDADGRVLAEDLVSGLQVPPQDNSSMDGYAVRTADITAPGVVLPVTQRIPAGHAGSPLEPGTCARIFTGAPMPSGADAVVRAKGCRYWGRLTVFGSIRCQPACAARRRPFPCMATALPGHGTAALRFQTLRRHRDMGLRHPNQRRSPPPFHAEPSLRKHDESQNPANREFPATAS